MIVVLAAIRTIMIALLATGTIMLMAVVIPRHKKILLPFFVLYISSVLFATLFTRAMADEGRGIYLLPFRFVYWIIQYAKGPTYHGIFRPILGVYLNILMFLPFGFLVKTWKPSISTWKIVLAGFSFSLLIEFTQLIFHLGMFETDDLMTNTLGAWLGTVLYRKRMQKA